MNNGYRLNQSGLLVRPEDLGDSELSVPAADVVDTVPMAVQSEDRSELDIWGEGNMPTPVALMAAVRRARQAVALQESDELRLAKSAEDVRADLEQARRHRDVYREFEDRVYQDRLAELDAQRAHQRVLARHERKRNEDAAEARQRLGQLLDPTSALIRLKRARLWAPMVALLPAVFAVVTGAVNVCTQMNRINPTTAWINWAIEPLFTLPILAILIAQIAGALPSVAEAIEEATSLRGAVKEALSNQYVRIEIGLGLLAAGLNVGLHFTGAEAAGGIGSAVWLVVPLGLAVSMYLVPKLLADLTAKFVAAKGSLPDAPGPLPTAINLQEHVQASGISEADRKVLSDALTGIATGALPSTPNGYAIHKHVMGGRGDKGRAYRVAALLREATSDKQQNNQD